MLDAVVGALIMLIATTSLLSAVEVIEKAFSDAGHHDLSPKEASLLCRLQKQQLIHFGKECDDDGLESERAQFRQDSILTLPQQVNK